MNDKIARRANLRLGDLSIINFLLAIPATPLHELARHLKAASFVMVGAVDSDGAAEKSQDATSMNTEKKLCRKFFGTHEW